MTCGDTQISARDLKSVITKLNSRDHMTGKTQFEEQFEVCALHKVIIMLWYTVGKVQTACINFHFCRF